MGAASLREKNHFFPEEVLPKRLRSLSEEPHWFWGLSPEMLLLKKDIDTIAPSSTELNILIVGETGTGKEFIAKFLHDRRQAQLGLNSVECPFVALNSGAIPESLAESILFGHERGSFTSARERQYGKFETARKGTLFLDEIQSLPISTQAKLLRTLQSKEFDRLGSKKSQAVECQIIAATNIPLEILTEQQRFRRDLYYRLNVCPLYLPALRQRKEDLPYLIRGLLSRLREKYSIKAQDIDVETYELMLSYAWPGNIRELEYALLYAGLRSKEIIGAEALPPSLTGKLLSYLSAGSWSA